MPQRRRSQLFTVRVWQEDIGDEQVEWRGRVEHVTSGQTGYFRDWPTLIKYLTALPNRADRREPDPES